MYGPKSTEVLLQDPKQAIHAKKKPLNLAK